MSIRVAIVHDWITGMRGGEQVLNAFLRIYPDADVYTMLHVKGKTTAKIDSRVVGTSALQRFPNAYKHYRKLLPLYPFFIKTIDLKGYDLVLSLSHAAAKNVRVEKGVRHVCYCFTPMRYIWDQAPEYLGGYLKLAYPLIKMLRYWDVRGAESVTDFIAISKLVAARIRKFYSRESIIIHPPAVLKKLSCSSEVSTEWGELEETSEKLSGSISSQPFLYAGALVPYKQVGAIVDACSELGVPLIVAGAGGQLASLKSRAGSSVKFVGRVDDSELYKLYQSCRALLFAGKEDFGIIPVEAQAFGCPVIGVNWGGIRETVKGIDPDTKNGFNEEGKYSGILVSPRKYKSVKDAMIRGIKFFQKKHNLILSENCRANASSFSFERFEKEWLEFIG